MHLIINTDGASRGNPGPAAYGFIIKVSGGAILHQEGRTLGVVTNNVAEYSAVLAALTYVNDHFGDSAPHRIEIVCDSQLVANQLSGNYKMKSEGLRPIYLQVKAVEQEIGVVTYKNVPRAENFIADRLANLALDAAK